MSPEKHKEMQYWRSLSVPYILIAVSTSGFALATTKFSPIVYLMCAIGILLFLAQIGTRNGGVGRAKGGIALFLLFLLLVPAAASLAVNSSVENAVSFFKFGLTLAFGSVLYLSFRFKQFLNIFSNSILFICVVSLIGYVLTNFTGLLDGLPIVKNVNDVEYRFAIVYFAFDGFLSYRNVGVFWEPGIFATMIFCALVADLFSNERAGGFRLYVLLAALLTTFSGASIVLFFIYVCLVINASGGNSRLYVFRRIIPIIFVVAIAAALALYLSTQDAAGYALFERLVDKLATPEETQSERLISPLLGMELFSESPIFGWGLSEAINRYQIIGDGAALTSTPFFMISAFGLFGIIYFVLPVVAIAIASRVSLSARVLLIIAFVFILNKEPHVYFTVTAAIEFYSLEHIVRRRRMA